MDQKPKNQEHSKKYRGIGPAPRDQPSKAPRQDEDGRDWIGYEATQLPPHYDVASPLQGVSNRPTAEEHAFPKSETTTEAADTPGVLSQVPSQQSGNRGGA
jgi:hypothetical protein